MSREYLYDDSREAQWDEKHSCKFVVEVPVYLTITVDGYDTEEAEDLGDRVDDAIAILCDLLYHEKKAHFFSNMERDEEYAIDVRDVI